MIEFEGMDEILRNIEELGKKGKAIEEKALNEGADHMMRTLKATNRFKDDTGTLRGSITKSQVKDGRIEVGPSDKGFYGRFLEFGFYNKRVKRQIPPRPWMAPEYETNVGKIQEIMKDTAKKELGL